MSFLLLYLLLPQLRSWGKNYVFLSAWPSHDCKMGSEYGCCLHSNRKLLKR